MSTVIALPADAPLLENDIKFRITSILMLPKAHDIWL